MNPSTAELEAKLDQAADDDKRALETMMHHHLTTDLTSD